MKTHSKDYGPIETPSAYDAVVDMRYTFMSPSLKTFQAYTRPVVLKKGAGQYLWDVDDKKYVDLMAQNLCISVGYNHPLVTREATKQIEQLGHCTTMYFNPVPAHFAKELTARMPAGKDWVAHFVNSGAEAIDLAQLMARLYTGNFELLALRNAYHGLHFSAMSLTGIQSCHHAVPVSSGILHVHNPDQYRGMHGATIDPYVEEIDAVINSSTPGRVAGFIAEPIQGYGGVIPLPDGYLAAAFERVRGDVVVTLDADLQNPPEEIPKLLAAIESGHDVVGGYRKKRQDSFFRKYASRIINGIRSKITNIRMRDQGCMLRAYRRNIVESIVASGETSTTCRAIARSRTMIARGFSSRCLRARSRRTAASSRASQSSW